MTVEVPWNAWFEDGEMALSFPDPWRVDVLRMTAPPAPPATVAERIATPLASEPLRTLARGKRLVGIAVDDIARPTPVHEFLPQVVDELLAAGVPEDGIQVFVASGAHRTPVLGDVVRKIGAPLAERLKIVYHNPYDNLADLGHTSSGVPIAINRSYLACDFRISIGGITPHDFAGFGGGYKTVTVGLSGIRALHETHIKRIAEFDAGVARIDGNRFQEYVQEIGAKVGIDFAINVVMTARRGIADLYAGDPDAVFRSACASARERYATPATGGYDVAVLNAYPKDIDWVQSMMALNVGFFGNETLVAEGGTVVLTTPAIDGGTLHYLGAEGMEGYARPGAEAMQGRRLIVCSPGINRHDVRTYFPAGAVWHASWSDTHAELKTRHGERCRACVVECASMQLLAP
jgi:nickel-dependent lactate racemase